MLRIKQVMQEQGRKQAWLADMLRISGGYATRLINGQRRWLPSHKLRAAAALGWPRDDVESLFLEIGRMICPDCGGIGMVCQDGGGGRVAWCGRCQGEGEVDEVDEVDEVEEG